MLNSRVFYHGIIRKTIVSFGALFSSIYIDRKEADSVNGEMVQRLKVPISYAPKEKWLVRLEQDPDLVQTNYVTLPRISFEITGYSYDPSRKTNRLQKIVCSKEGDTMSSVFSPVPYNIEMSLYVLTKTQEDAMQIIEQILPTFTPEYTLTIKSLPEMNITQDVPIILNSISVQDDYDGDFQVRRFVTHTLNFTLKTNLYGSVDNGKLITNVTAGVTTVDSQAATNEVTYNAVGNLADHTVQSEDWTLEL